MKQEAPSIRPLRRFAKKDDRVPRRLATSLPARRIDWMPQHHTLKIIVRQMYLSAYGGSLSGIRPALC
jgi:hypothetical protein